MVNKLTPEVLKEMNFIDGKLPVIIQDYDSKDVIHMVYMTKDEILKCMMDGALTVKGHLPNGTESEITFNGKKMKIMDILYDDNKTMLLMKIYLKKRMRIIKGEKFTIFSHQNPEGEYLDQLYRTMKRRVAERPEGSYTVAIMDHEPRRLKKVVEEAGELVIQAARHDRDWIIHEAADLMYHTLLVLLAEGVTPRDVREELRRREYISKDEE